MPLDAHTRRALFEAVRDLNRAALLAVEHAADAPFGDPVDKALNVFDAIADAIKRIRGNV